MPMTLKTQPNLWDYEPPPVVAEFDPDEVRGKNLAARLSMAISKALSTVEASRAQIAARMTGFLGGPPVTKAMLDAYAAQSRPDHSISVPRFVALLHATQDRRLAQMLVEGLGWAVIEKKYLPLIEVAELREQEDRIRRRVKTLTAQAGRR
ncbi:hypothetical protein VQH23_07550 [Pararoseomonas sp. SCSIO 73927]|uniref:hypothetical protein n=1 Tax=Pararoseomonas sp. SCSIO 73927 TaxID=3114537 RepID=UPI0030CBB7C4